GLPTTHKPTGAYMIWAGSPYAHFARDGSSLRLANRRPFKRRTKMATTPVSTSLKWDVLVTKRQGLNRDLPPGKEQWMWVPTSATLISGERDAVLVDAFLTVEQVHAAVEWIAASSKNPTTIYITHGHGDHFFGIGA